MHSLEIEDFFQLQSPILDVRSPAEFSQGHIPGAINLPLFSDHQRSVVGTIYAQSGQTAAIEKGFQFVGQDIQRLTQGLHPFQSNEIDPPQTRTQDTPTPSPDAPSPPTPKPTHPLRLHCWRGGMRSQSVAWYAKMLGIESVTLAGGYKAYRRSAIQHFQLPWKIITLSGLTGAGKTEILQELQRLGEQVVDLEGLANHRGSAFGWIGLPPQPANQLFENKLFEALSKLDPERRVWVEDEARAIGKIRVPQDFWAHMRTAPVLFADAPLEFRIKNLLTVYGGYPSADLAAAIQQIHKRFGAQRTQAALEALQSGDLPEVTRMTLEYYDQAYSRSASRRTEKNVYRLNSHESHETTAQELISAADQLDDLAFETMSTVLEKLEKSVAS